MTEPALPAIDHGDVRIWHGDALATLTTLPPESVQCIVTSPPFWALRDYGTAWWEGGDEACDHQASTGRERATRPAGGLEGGKATVDAATIYRASCGRCGATRVDDQIGLEETPDAWCAKLVEVFRECRRVLRSDGVAWIEVGDTYNAYNGNRAQSGGISRAADHARPTPNRGLSTSDLKPKDLVGAPWMLAFALRADGWYLRSDTIWARPNPMPESVVDRPTKAHSYVFLLSKTARYYYDADAIRDRKGNEATLEEYANRPKWDSGGLERGAGANKPSSMTHPFGANARSVWSIPTEPTPFAHFATFPQALVARCINAGTSEHGACTECGAPYARTTDRTVENPGNRGMGATRRLADGSVRSFVERREVIRETTGWAPTCQHSNTAYSDTRPCVVLDPFMGSGTTAVVARQMGRHAIGVELSGEYLAIARDRLGQGSLLT